MRIKPIKSEVDYDAALTAIDRLMGATPGTPEGDELDILVTLVEAHEAAHWPINAQRPIGTPRLYRRSVVINCQYVPPMYRHGDGRALACSEASRRRQRSER